MSHASKRSAEFVSSSDRSRGSGSLRPANRRRGLDTPSILKAAIEPLESRTLLSVASNGFDLTKMPVYRATSTDLNDLKAGPLAVAGGSLANLYLDFRRADKNDNPLKLDAAEQQMLLTDLQHVVVDIGTRVDFKLFSKRMTALGMTIVSSDASMGVVEGILPIDQVLNVATRSDVAILRPVFRAITHQAGAANNQGDRSLNTDDLRRVYGLSGAGVTVGVVSDSYNQTSGRDFNPFDPPAIDAQGKYNTSVDTGDLPANVNVLNDFNDATNSATDEGRAMLEEIHDIAPSASLAFSTGSGGLLTFANHVRALNRAGASVITDDLGYSAEPFFGPGVLDQAISDVVANNAIYTSAAGNDAESGFQQDARYATVNNRRFIDFDPSANVATRMLVKFSTGGQLSFQWDNPYNGITGDVSADMDIRFYQPGTNTVVASGIDFNFATGVPVENLLVPAGNYEVEIQLVSVEGGQQPPTVYRVAGDAGVSYTKYSTTRANAFGHSASASAISVAAADYNDTPPFDNRGTVTEEFSSSGPVKQIFDIDGNRLSRPAVLQKPDITGVDGINTSFFGSDSDNDGLPNFFGTSAAAPNIAAGAALIKQVAPRATQKTVLSALKTTARSINGTSGGKYDAKGGFGLADFQAALPAALGAFKADISAVSPNPRQDPIGNLTITFSQRVSGFDINDLTLTRSGGPDLLNSRTTLTTSDNITFTLHNLTSVTPPDGNYVLTLTGNGSGIRNALGTSFKRDVIEKFTVYTPGPPPARPGDLTVVAIGATANEITFTDNSNNEAGFQILKSTDSTFASPTIIRLGANVTSFLDEDLKPSTRYFYRVRAVNGLNGNSSYTASVSSLTAVTGDVVVDNSSKYARVTGAWTTVPSDSSTLGTNYLSDNNSGKGTKSVKYIPRLAGDGSYYIYARWTRSSSNATNVPFDIYYGPGSTLKQRILVDQRNRGGSGWTLIGGPLAMEAGTGASVVIRNAGTNGRVIADAIRFLPSGPLTTQRLNAASPGSSNPFANGSTFGSSGNNDKDDKNDLSGLL